MKMVLLITALLVSTAATAGSAQQTGPAIDQTTQAPGYYRVKVGRLIVTVLTDGATSVPYDKLLQGRSSKDIIQIFAATGESASRPTSINAFLVDTGDRRILIDAGAGTLFGSCCGRLPETLAAAGYRPEQIDAVLLTHVHGDHSGGLLHGGERTFPNAQLYLAKPELDYWMSDAERARAKPSHQKMFTEGRAALAPYIAAGRIHTFTGRTTIFPGITAIPAPGHTPGHSFYELESDGHRLLVIGDTVHAAEVQLPDPSVTVDYDVDPAAAAVRWKATLAQLAQSHELAAGNHLSFPGLGHVIRSGSGFAFTPLPYDAGVPDVGE